VIRSHSQNFLENIPMAEQDGCLVPMIIQKSHNHQQLPLQCADLLLTLAQRSTGITGEDNYHLVI
jgi:hypothetical protein